MDTLTTILGIIRWFHFKINLCVSEASRNFEFVRWKFSRWKISRISPYPEDSFRSLDEELNGRAATRVKGKFEAGRRGVKRRTRGLSQGNEIYEHRHRRGNFLGDKSLLPFLALFPADRNETRPKDGGTGFHGFSDRAKPLSISSSRIPDYHIKWTEVFAVIGLFGCITASIYLLKKSNGSFSSFEMLDEFYGFCQRRRLNNTSFTGIREIHIFVERKREERILSID